MHRRELLRGAAAAAALGLAGCSGSGAPGDGTETPTDEPQTEIVDAEFDVTGIDNAGEVTADATIDDAANSVSFTGTIEGSDGCKTAVLDAVEYTRAADEVHLKVRTENRPGTDDRACTQALVYIGYEATVTFEGGTPRRAVVSHDGREIMSGAHDSASAGDGS